MCVLFHICEFFSHFGAVQERRELIVLQKPTYTRETPTKCKKSENQRNQLHKKIIWTTTTTQPQPQPPQPQQRTVLGLHRHIAAQAFLVVLRPFSVDTQKYTHTHTQHTHKQQITQSNK